MIPGRTTLAVLALTLFSACATVSSARVDVKSYLDAASGAVIAVDDATDALVSEGTSEPAVLRALLELKKSLLGVVNQIRLGYALLDAVREEDAKQVAENVKQDIGSIISTLRKYGKDISKTVKDGVK